MSAIVEHRPPEASLAEQAYAALEEMLVTLQLRPGALLQERDITAAIGIGRTPVREAVLRMAAHGVLKILPRKGLLVAPVLRSELQQVVEARRVLERLLVVKAAERADSDQRGALAALAAHLDTPGTDRASFLRLDRTLDELLEAACRNVYLVQALAPLHIHCRRLWYLHGSGPDLEQSAALHAGLARAVAQGDRSGAVRALNGIIKVIEHIVGGLDSLS